MAGLIGLIILFGAGIFANFIAPYSYEQIDLNNILAPPTLAGHHFFGTDEIGRDYFSRVIWGIRTSEEVGVLVAVMSTFIGLVIGAIAGFYGGWGDNLLMRFTDLVLTLPFLAILLTAAALLGQGSQWRVTFILALLFWTGTARVVRGIFLSLREKEYVEAAKAAGAGDARIMFRHILPNTLGPVVVAMTLAVATAILIEAALSFLGFGIKPPTPSLGVLMPGRPDEPAAVVAHRLPGHNTRPDRALRELRRRRPARCARPDPAESPCLSLSCRSRTWRSSSARTTESSTRWTTSRTTSSPARRWASSASPDRARASARCRFSG